MGGNAATSKSIQRFNAVIQKQADSFNYTVVNIFDISQSLGNQVVMDGLHPSAEQYKAWVEEILPVAIQVIRS
jgi:lysophospholipase L1-like esterase